MKAVVNEKQKGKEYPKLMISNSRNIVLFSEWGTGVLISSEGTREDIGENTSSWDMEGFKDFNGTVTLSND